MPKCTINGKQIEVPKGTTIIEAFKLSGQDIAHYCWHPGLSVAGVCRLCMVQIEGQPRLQIACNTQVADGMVINNTSEPVKEAVRWGMDFHLINHPLDCPICDQAGECGLQEQYMKYGQYDPEMAEPKVKKRKAVSLGPTVMLDTERCILCSRCVRFTEEVSKTSELRICQRGDHSEIGTYENKPLDNNYSVNTVDICPVGALTSKDFRFKQRVWYLKNADTICTGCSTGCNVKVYYNEDGAFRVKPNHNDKINGYWMCDKGRDIYKFVNKEARLTQAKKGSRGQWQMVDPIEATQEAGKILRESAQKNPNGVALVLTGQYSSEEYKALFEFVTSDLRVNKVYHWINNQEDMEGFDGLLFRGDRNPNTAGLKKILDAKGGPRPWSELLKDLEAGKIDCLVVAGPENNAVFPDLATRIAAFSHAKNLIYLASGKSEIVDAATTATIQIPLKVFFEKDGTYTNYAGIEQKVVRGATFVAAALSLIEVTTLLAGKELHTKMRATPEKHNKENFQTTERGSL